MPLRRALMLVGACLLAGGVATAKPLVIDVAMAFDHAMLVAEADVVEVEYGAWMAWGGQRGRVRVRVTDDPERIYRGIRHLGSEIDLVPPSEGAQKWTASLRRTEDRERILVVVNDDREIVLAGERFGAGYVVRGWCDYSACRLLSSDPEFDGEMIELKGSQEMHPAGAAIAARYEKERRADWARVTLFLAGMPPALTADQVDGLVAELAAPDGGVRARAAHHLATQGHLSVALLRDARRRAEDPDVVRALDGTLAMLAEFDDAERVARRLANTDRAARRYVAEEGIHVLGGPARECANTYLVRLDALDALDGAARR